MVFPSSACLTCKARRIKCDNEYPLCNRCRKSCRGCAWECSGASGVTFRTENAFAKGKLRRPRKRDVDCLDEELISPLRFVDLSSSVDWEVLAFNYWRENFVGVSNNLVGEETLHDTLALQYLQHASPSPSLRLAVSAFSLAAFARCCKAEVARKSAQTSYINCIVQLRKEVKNIAATGMDQLIVVTMLLARYGCVTYGTENLRNGNGMFLHPATNGKHPWEDLWHNKGTVGLLYMRQRYGFPRDLVLERSARRALIRSCILRAVSVPNWMLSGGLFGETGPFLELDRLFIAVAGLRSRFRELTTSHHAVLIDTMVERESLLFDAERTDYELSTWALNLSYDWRYTVLPSPAGSKSRNADFIYDEFFHMYTALDVASNWNRYRALRLCINSITMALVSEESQDKLRAIDKKKLRSRQNNINELMTDMCRSVHYFFYFKQLSSLPKEPHSLHNFKFPARTEATMHPRNTWYLSWPLAIATRTPNAPILQKIWLKRILGNISTILGDGLLQSIVNEDLFSF